MSKGLADVIKNARVNVKDSTGMLTCFVKVLEVRHKPGDECLEIENKDGKMEVKIKMNPVPEEEKDEYEIFN